VREELETLQQARTPDAALGANRWKPLATADTRLARLGDLPWVWADSRMLADVPSKIESDNEAVAQAQNTLIDQLLALLAQTRLDILLVSPYLVPGPRMMAQLAAIRQKGVRVRILTNSLASTDAPAAHVGYARYRPAMLALGIDLYEMRAGHANQRH
jgi:putative cardiolipin synthase